MRSWYLGVVFSLSMLPGVRAETPTGVVREHLREIFPYRAAPGSAEHSATSRVPDFPKEAALVLETFVVAAPQRERGLAKAIDDGVRRAEAEKFSLTRGGALVRRDFGKCRLEAGMWSNGALVRLSW